jgi:hypothetical protein
MSDTQGFSQQGLPDANSPFHAIGFLIRQALGLTRTATLVKVTAIHGGGVGPPPTVDVTPLVHQIDGAGIKTEHSTVYGIQVSRNHGGTSSVINDPKVGDIGWVTIGDRDHSSVVSSAAAANPASFRRHSLSDGVYTAGLPLKVTPNQYLYFMPNGGVKLVDQFNNVVCLETGPIIYIDPHGTQGKVYLGGDGQQGTYALVQTVSGPSINVYARIS